MPRGAMYRPPRIRFYTPRQLRQQANQQVRSSIAAQQAPIISAQKLADARAAAAQKAIAGFGTAAAGFLQQAAPQAGQAYREAGQAEAGLAAGYAGQTAQDIQQQVAQSQAEVAQLAPGGQVAHPDTQGIQNTMYALGGYLPGSLNEEQAASAIRQASEQPAISAGRTQETLTAAQAQATQDDQQYVQDMLDLAKQEPQLRQQIMQQLQQNELAKRNAWIQQQAQAALTGYRGAELQQSQQRINIEARRMMIAERQGNARIALEAGNLKLAQARERLAVRQALIAGRRIDASASHAAGYLIDRNGNPILNGKGQRIVVKSGSSGGGGGATRSDRQQAFRYIQKNYKQQYLSPGVPDPLWKPTPFRVMQNYLMGSYSLSRAQARAMLRRAGFKPDGKRSGK